MEQTVIFGPGPVGLQLQEDFQYGSRVVRFVDGGPSVPGQARACGMIQPGDWITRVQVHENDPFQDPSRDDLAPATTYAAILWLLQQTHLTRELTVRSFALSALLELDLCASVSGGETTTPSLVEEGSVKDDDERHLGLIERDGERVGLKELGKIRNQASSMEGIKDDKRNFSQEATVGSTSRNITQMIGNVPDEATELRSTQAISSSEPPPKLPLHLLIHLSNSASKKPLLLIELGRKRTYGLHEDPVVPSRRRFGIPLTPPPYSKIVEPRLFHPDPWYSPEEAIQNNLVHLPMENVSGPFPGIISLPSLIIGKTNGFKSNLTRTVFYPQSVAMADFHSDLEERPMDCIRFCDKESSESVQRKENVSLSSETLDTSETMHLPYHVFLSCNGHVQRKDDRLFPGEIILPVATVIYRHPPKTLSNSHTVSTFPLTFSLGLAPSCLDEKQSSLLPLQISEQEEIELNNTLATNDGRKEEFPPPSTTSRLVVMDPLPNNDSGHTGAVETGRERFSQSVSFSSSAAATSNEEKAQKKSSACFENQNSIITTVYADSSDLLQKARSKHQLSLARLRVKEQFQKRAEKKNLQVTTAPEVGSTPTSSDDFFEEKATTTLAAPMSKSDAIEQPDELEQQFTRASSSQLTCPPHTPPSAPYIDFSQFSHEKTVIFEPGPVGMQLEPTASDTANYQNHLYFDPYYYPAKIVRFVDGYPTDSGQARRSGKLRPGDFVVRVEAEGIVGTTYYTILHLLQKSWTTRKLTFRSAWDPDSIAVVSSGQSEILNETSSSPKNTSPLANPPGGMVSPSIGNAQSPQRLSALKDSSPLPYDWTPLPFDWVNRRRQPRQPETLEEKKALEEAYHIEASRLFREREEKRQREKHQQEQNGRLSSWNFENLMLGAVAVTAESVIGCLRKTQQRDYDEDEDEEGYDEQNNSHQKCE